MVGEYVDAGTFVTDDLVKQACEQWWLNDSDEEETWKPSTDNCRRVLSSVAEHLYTDNPEEAVWQIFSLTDSIGRMAFWAQWTFGSSWEGLDQRLLGGAVTLDGALVTNGVAYLGDPRRVLVTTAGAESGKTMTITGTDANGNVQSDTVDLPNASTVYTALDFLTVTGITISATAAGAIIVGTNGIGGSRWVRFNDFAPSNISIQCDVSGTVNYTVQSTLDDPNDPFNPVTAENVVWVSSSDVAVVGANSTQQSNFLFTPKYAKILINSGSGTVTATFLQSSNGPR